MYNSYIMKVNLRGYIMDYNDIVNGMNQIGCVISVEFKPDGSCGEICVEAANDIYLASVNVSRDSFVPGRTIL
jgi:hypothetical protein